MLDDYLFTRYCIIQHNRLHNFKIIKKFSGCVMGKLCRVIAVFIARLCRNSTDVWGKILSEGKEKKAFCHVAHNGNFSSCSEYIIECKIKSSRLHQLILS